MKNRNIKNIVILHGWKLSGDKYDDVKKLLEEQGYRVFSPDMPGFGNNPAVNDNMHMEDYVSFLVEYLEKEKIDECVLIGHSFGGRVITAFLGPDKNIIKHNFHINGVVFTGTPLLPSKFSLRKRIGIIISRLGKKVITVIPLLSPENQIIRKVLYRFVGEYDYFKSGNLKNTFVNIINYPLIDKLSIINVPTLIIWGKNDRITPLEDAIRINKLINGSKLIIVENATHKLPYENPDIFAENVLNFIKEL